MNGHTFFDDPDGYRCALENEAARKRETRGWTCGFWWQVKRAADRHVRHPIDWAHRCERIPGHEGGHYCYCHKANTSAWTAKGAK